MQRRRPPVPVILVLVLLIAAAAYYFYSSRQASASTALAASGTIEATDVRISPETSGRVAEVLVDEGDIVHAGDKLLALDDSLLKAQRALGVASLESAKGAAATASAALVSAQAQYSLALDAALGEERTRRATAWQSDTPGEFDQPTWYFTQLEQLTAAQAEVEAANQALNDAQVHLEMTERSAAAADFVAAEARLLDARAAFLSAQGVFDRAETATDASELRDAAQAALDDATTELDDAQAAYDDALTTQGAPDVLTARAGLAVAQERFDTANDQVRALQTGVNAPRVVAAQAVVDQAQSAADQGQNAIRQAQANLDLLDTQLGKLVLLAPSDGVVMTRSVEPGEVVAPGAAALTLGLLNDLSITVYVPEDRYGTLRVGQQADVTVDSFPTETFSAVVTHIADQAEFTPRNVQTAEGRANTVYAIQLSVEDPQGKLKPGMPADVTFR
jgi:membrane fusion protein YbhG